MKNKWNVISEELEFKRRSQVIQRSLPRPNDITIPLRSIKSESNLSDLQKVSFLNVHFEKFYPF